MATGGNGRQKAAKGGKGACVSQPCGGKELPVLRLHATVGMVAPLKGVRTSIGRFRAAKVRLYRGVSCVPQKCAIKGRSCVIMMRHRRGGCSSKRGAHYQFRKVPHRKSAASPGRFMCAAKVRYQGAFVRRTVWQQRTVPRGAAETQLAFLTFVQNSYPISP